MVDVAADRKELAAAIDAALKLHQNHNDAIVWVTVDYRSGRIRITAKSHHEIHGIASTRRWVITLAPIVNSSQPRLWQMRRYHSRMRAYVTMTFLLTGIMQVATLSPSKQDTIILIDPRDV